MKKAFYLIYLLPIPFLTTWFDLNRVPYTSYFLLFATLIMGLLLVRLRMSHFFIVNALVLLLSIILVKIFIPENGPYKLFERNISPIFYFILYFLGQLIIRFILHVIAINKSVQKVE
ncbi:hypothetical protein [Bacillus sp. AFS053548]|uniref:hypothetical protein n=1 Tax=Bacillus sp. AFS053548 TaxID=2033505 RepID=UPI000BFB5826|nr:hypothetical protein [Bacillus sp. AFS053548]PGM57018.1 hypothetical protein CN946_08705 [Bacillus sp. AFS053548]